MKPFILIEHDGGECRIEAVGFKGSACEVPVKLFEQSLGDVTKRTLKPEYYQRDVQVTQNISNKS